MPSTSQVSRSALPQGRPMLRAARSARRRRQGDYQPSPQRWECFNCDASCARQQSAPVHQPDKVWRGTLRPDSLEQRAARFASAVRTGSPSCSECLPAAGDTAKRLAAVRRAAAVPPAMSPARLSPAALLLWLSLCVVAQCSVALFGVASRWLQAGCRFRLAACCCVHAAQRLAALASSLHCATPPALPLPQCLQTKASPPISALRLLLVVSLLAFGTLLLLDACVLALAPLRQVWQLYGSSRARQGDGAGQPHRPAGSAADLKAAKPTVGSQGELITTGSTSKGDAPQEEGMAADGGATGEALQRPDVPLKRGLSRRLVGLEVQHPRCAVGSLPLWLR